MSRNSEAFENFHAKHPEVYAQLLRLSRQWRRRGHGQWSIWGAFQVLRWEMRMAGLPDADELYKLNNNYTGYYARKVMAENADLEGLFEIRRMKDEVA